MDTKPLALKIANKEQGNELLKKLRILGYENQFPQNGFTGYTKYLCTQYAGRHDKVAFLDERGTYSRYLCESESEFLEMLPKLHGVLYVTAKKLVELQKEINKKIYKVPTSTIKRGQGIIFDNIPMTFWHMTEGKTYIALEDSSFIGRDEIVSVQNDVGDISKFNVEYFTPIILNQPNMKETPISPDPRILYVSPQEVKNYYNHPDVCIVVKKEIRAKFDLFSNETRFKVDLDWFKEKYSQASIVLRKKLESDFPNVFPPKNILRLEKAERGMEHMKDFLGDCVLYEVYKNIPGSNEKEKTKTILNLIYDTYR